ncbi:MAG: 50S ribosomal protein L17 [bacterium]
MRHKIKGRRLGRNPASRKALLRNAASSLFIHRRIKTTKSIARELRSYAEKLITTAKVDDFNARRRAARKLYGKKAVKVLFEEIGPTFKEVNGGYTRIMNLDYRKGDNARMALLEIISSESKPSAKKTTRRGRRKKAEKKDE